MTVRLDHPLVVGAGVAGLSVALASPRATVLTSGLDGSTGWAQGGIAAAVGDDDDPEIHAADTLLVSGGLAVRAVVERLTDGGPAAIARLLEFGATFDVDDRGRLRLGREAGHRRRRIVHADGDATGAEVRRALESAAEASGRVNVLRGWTAIDLLRDDRVVVGVLADDPDGRRVPVFAPGVVLATGGIGRLYLRTTNPEGVTGEGIAMAARAGARLADLEFVQFHPTALAAGLDPMPLVTEALRGEGALLVDGDGGRFMPDVHPDAELAPRDVVARAIWRRLTEGRPTFLDARGIGGMADRFPTVTGIAARAGLDPAVDLLPVSPAVHYSMGGIDADHRGRTSLPGLWAVGECAATGVHGANRLASNSLLEGLVFGAAAAADVARVRPTVPSSARVPGAGLELPLDPLPEIEVVRSIMWEEAGVVRTGAGLASARHRLAELHESLHKTVPGRSAASVAGHVVAAAIRRTESRGGHFRADHPLPDPSQAARLIVEPVPESADVEVS